MSINLLNFDRQALRDYFATLGEKPYRADQVLKWIHQQGVIDFSAMTNLSLKLRTHLQENVSIILPTIIKEQMSQDGTRKWLLQLDDNEQIEMVFIPEDFRGTLCISSQVGCALGCKFCATGRLGYKRNLTFGEIIGQLWIAIKQLSGEKFAREKIITNVVMMGEGEPLLNFDSVVKALDLMLDDNAYGLSKYRVTLSTCGIIPEMQRLRERTPVCLAVSLHAPTDELRSEIMPINKKYPLTELIKICKSYFDADPRRAVTFEYIMIDKVNDTQLHARQLVKLLHGMRCKVNLIPYNSTSDNEFKPSRRDAIESFRNILLQAGINTITRKTRGQDIAAACGQLAAT